MNKKIFIIVPMIGVVREEVIAALEKAALMIKEIGMIPVTPFEVVSKSAGCDFATKRNIPRLLECGSFIKLQGWENDKYASLQVVIAKTMNIPELAIYVGKYKGGGQ